MSQLRQRKPGKFANTPKLFIVSIELVIEKLYPASWLFLKIIAPVNLFSLTPMFVALKSGSSLK